MSYYEITFPLFTDHVSFYARDLIVRLMEADSSKRLGAGVTGAKDIRDHLFFASIAWEKLEQKQVPPPYIPEKVVENEDVNYDDFTAMMRAYEKEMWLRETVNPDLDQRFFGSWDFVSKEAQRIEFGLANQMEQYETNMKVRKLLGASGPESPVKKLSLSIKGAASAVLGRSQLGAQRSHKVMAASKEPSGDARPSGSSFSKRLFNNTVSREWSFE